MAADSYGTKNEPQFAGSGVPNDAGDLTLVGRTPPTSETEGRHHRVRSSLTGSDVWPGLIEFSTPTPQVVPLRQCNLRVDGPPRQRSRRAFGFRERMSNMGKTRLSPSGTW